MSPAQVRLALQVRAVTLTPAALALIGQPPPPMPAPRVKTSLPPQDAPLRKPLKNSGGRQCIGWNHSPFCHYP